jgi:subtilase family serine protease
MFGKAQSLNNRFPFRSRLLVEELEPRTLLSVYTPAQILHAYGTDQISFNQGTVKGDGSGQTIAIIDAYFDPTIQSDLAAFSKQFNLAPLDGKSGDGTFTQIDLSHKTLSPVNDDWTMETALDVEWLHAVAPKANIVLVEAASDYQNALTGEPTDLLNAVKTAANYPGVSVVSMSWGISEVPQETSWDSYFTTPGVTFVAASGDSGAGTTWPAVSPNVVSVGGTSLNLTRTNTIARETGWGHGFLSSYYGGSGGGFSQFEPLPSYQQQITTSSNGFSYTSFSARLSPDVAYNADPNTGYYVLNGADGGWFAVGGTSAGAPQWAGLIAIADQGRALAKLAPLSSAQTLAALYANPSDFHDIVGGSTGAYLVTNSNGAVIGQITVAARSGYDLVTGLGTPMANVLVPALAKAGAKSNNLQMVVASSTQSSGTSGSSSNSSSSNSSSGHSGNSGSGSKASGNDSGGAAASNAAAIAALLAALQKQANSPASVSAVGQAFQVTVAAPSTAPGSAGSAGLFSSLTAIGSGGGEQTEGDSGVLQPSTTSDDEMFSPDSPAADPEVPDGD